MQVIEGLLEVYKFQHLIQIIRWLGMTHSKYDADAWTSASRALSERMLQETDLSTELTECDGLRM